jgi:Guanosine polyphosphate pyrophosphohydrolases/synthetases
MTAYSGRFDKALIYASALYRALRPASGSIVPISRPLAIAALIIEAGGSEDEAIGGLLLDLAAGDFQPHVLDEIHRLFGADVCQLIGNCLASDYRKPRRTHGHIRLLSTGLAAQLARSTLIALADSMVGALALHARLLNQDHPENLDPMMDHYNLLAQAFGQIRPGTLSEQFALIVADLTALASPYANFGPRTIS